MSNEHADPGYSWAYDTSAVDWEDLTAPASPTWPSTRPIRDAGWAPRSSALYAEGVQDFTLDLRILKHEASYLVSEILYGKEGPSDRTAIIGHIGFEWIQHFCPGTWAAHPPSSFRGIEQESVYHYLNALFRPDG